MRLDGDLGYGRVPRLLRRHPCAGDVAAADGAPLLHAGVRDGVDNRRANRDIGSRLVRCRKLGVVLDLHLNGMRTWSTAGEVRDLSHSAVTLNLLSRWNNQKIPERAVRTRFDRRNLVVGSELVVEAALSIANIRDGEQHLRGEGVFEYGTSRSIWG